MKQGPRAGRQQDWLRPVASLRGCCKPNERANLIKGNFFQQMQSSQCHWAYGASRISHSAFFSLFWNSATLLCAFCPPESVINGIRWIGRRRNKQPHFIDILECWQLSFNSSTTTTPTTTWDVLVQVPLCRHLWWLITAAARVGNIQGLASAKSGVGGQHCVL